MRSKAGVVNARIVGVSAPKKLFRGSGEPTGDDEAEEERLLGAASIRGSGDLLHVRHRRRWRARRVGVGGGFMIQFYASQYTRMACSPTLGAVPGIQHHRIAGTRPPCRGHIFPRGRW